jgi:hypothetical protein
MHFALRVRIPVFFLASTIFCQSFVGVSTNPELMNQFCEGTGTINDQYDIPEFAWIFSFEFKALMRFPFFFSNTIKRLQLDPGAWCRWKSIPVTRGWVTFSSTPLTS